MRQHLLAQRPEIGGVAEHLAHMDGEEAQQIGQDGRLVQHPVLQHRQALAAEILLRPHHPPQDGAAGIAAKIELVATPQKVEQRIQLQQLQLFLGLGRRGQIGHHRGIHTRTSDSSLSTSSGLAR